MNQTRSSFSVLTINVRFGLADSGQHRWENRQAAFAALFAEWRPDFIAMQEVNHFQKDFFQDLLVEYHCIGQRDPAPDFWQDVLIFYQKQWQCLDYQRFFLSLTPEVPSRLPESQWPRQCILGKFRQNRQTIVCANTHFDFADAVQQKSARLIQDRLNRLAAPEIPQILTGDFNAGPGRPCHALLTSDRYTAHPFEDAFAAETAGTFHNFTGQPVSERIDWILWRGRAVLCDKQVITRPMAGRYPSDHFPVYAAFQGLPGLFSHHG